MLAWVAGVVFGVQDWAPGWRLVRRPPAYIVNWRIGAEGEQKTARALERTRVVGVGDMVHDVNCSRGNYDHIVVGPAGVFLLGDQEPSGASCTCETGSRTLRRRLGSRGRQRVARRSRSSGAGNRGAPQQGAPATNRLSALGRTPVVVLWSDFEPGIYGDGRCALAHPRLCVLQGNGSRRAPARSMRRQPTSWSQLYARSRLTDAAAANAWRDPRLCSPPQWGWKGGSRRGRKRARGLEARPADPRDRHPLPAGAGETRHVACSTCRDPRCT